MRGEDANAGAQHPVPAFRLTLSPADRARVLDMIDRSLSTGVLTLGPTTEAFEEAFAARHGCRFAVAVSSGTAALEILLRSVGVAGREVVVPTNTFFATAAAVVHAGGTPRLVDVVDTTLAPSAAIVEAAVTDRTAAVVLVHIAGTVTPDVEAIAEVCRRRGVDLIEDAAHAHGSAWAGRPAGSFGRAAAFSFYPTKVVTSGEGGMIVTDDAGVRDEAVLYRDQGKAGFLGGDHVRMGSAWRMSELHAALGLVQLGHLDEHIAVRRDVARRYDRGLAAVPGITAVPRPETCDTNLYKYVALLDGGIDRAEFKARMRAHAVHLAGEVYAMPLHRQPVFSELGGGPFPVADDVCRRQVCLPVHSDMTPAEADRVVASVRQVLGQDLTLVAGR
jgi:dTDP-4-amino-4,6-dideoxygalactose transaminase